MSSSATVQSARAIFASNLRKVRLSKQLSQEALAERACLHRTFVGCVERNEKNISIESMERLAVALGIDLRELLAPEVQ